MQIRNIHLKNFRCFNQLDLQFDSPIVLIAGANGSGKTSILEALHYACYLRSFRAPSARELIAFQASNFFIKTGIEDTNDNLLNHEIQIGFSHKKKLVKIDQRSVSSYKELTHYYRVITVTEDDLGLIKEGPDIRRAFIDQAIMLIDSDYLLTLRAFKQVLNNRNALLSSRTDDKASYLIWTQQLWDSSYAISNYRLSFLAQFQERVNELLDAFFSEPLFITFSYKPKKNYENEITTFNAMHDKLYEQEMLFGRSLFGAHLDDIHISFKGKASKNYASRGQQKLIVALLKIAQLNQLLEKTGNVVLLLDDFMTDFDPENAERVLRILANIRTQLVFTSPLQTGYFEEQLIKRGAQRHLLTT